MEPRGARGHRERNFRQTEINYIVGNSHTLWPAKPGSIGRPYPGHRVACIDEGGSEVPVGEIGELAAWAEDDPVLFLEYWRESRGDAQEVTQDTGAEPETSRNATTTAISGTRVRADDVFKSAGYRHRSGGDRELPGQASRGRECRGGGQPRDAERTNIVKAFIVLTPGHEASAALEAELQEHVRGRLAPYEYPQGVRVSRQLPMTTTGKIQRRILRNGANRKRKGNPVTKL